MTAIMCVLNEDVNRALKNYAIEHGNISKSKAATELVEQWLKDKGYLDPNTKEQYEYLE